jgi:hydroxymethylpyrimidine pyrophosphatase-like HAD family hydrolase
MYFLALASDYDGTLAHDGMVDDATLAAVRRLQASGRKLILVTGRELPDLQRVFPMLRLCDRVVAENGALLYVPATQEERPLAPPPPEAFVNLLRARNVSPLSVGRSIVATWEPNETVVLEAIREFGPELQIVFNKGAVMVLPSGVKRPPDWPPRSRTSSSRRTTSSASATRSTITPFSASAAARSRSPTRCRW